MDFDTTVKLTLYDCVARTTVIPNAAEVSNMLNHSLPEVEEAFGRLQQKRLLLIEPGTKDRVRMAPPFSGIPTQHVVRIDGKSYFANCAWDALGVAAALHRDAEIQSRCGDCDALLHFEVRGGRPIDQPCVIHFAVPAAYWWDDLIFT